MSSYKNGSGKCTSRSATGSLAEYILTKPLGEGAFSRAFRAEVVRILNEDQAERSRLRAQDIVVVKIPNYDCDLFSFWEIRSHLDTVEREARRAVDAMRRLSGVTGIARILDRGAWDVCVQGDTLASSFIVQEYIEGETLTDHLTRCFPAADGAFQGVNSAAKFFDYAEQIASILRAVHQHNVVHGDIWPQNILAKNGDLVFIDFGSSVFRDRSYFDPARTFLKSHAYIAPERLNGILGRREGRRSDIFSVGGTLFYIACGLDPMRPDPDLDRHKLTIVRALEERNRDLLDENPGIADIIARCTRHRKDDRTTSADALLSEIRTFSNPTARRSSGPGFTCTFDRIRDALENLQNQGDSLFHTLAELELSVQCSEIEDMSRGVLDVCGDHEHIVSTLCRCLSILRSGDSLLIRSSPQLWHPLNLGVNGRFLSMCCLLAKAGVRVVILLLLCQEDRGDPTALDIVSAHKNAASRVCDENASPTLSVRCIAVSSSERETRLAEGWQRGVMLHSDRSYTFEPILNESGEVVSVRLLSKGDPIPKVHQDCNNDLEASLGLREWLAQDV